MDFRLVWVLNLAAMALYLHHYFLPFIQLHFTHFQHCQYPKAIVEQIIMNATYPPPQLAIHFHFSLQFSHLFLPLMVVQAARAFRLLREENEEHREDWRHLCALVGQDTALGESLMLAL